MTQDAEQEQKLHLERLYSFSNGSKDAIAMVDQWKQNSGRQLSDQDSVQIRASVMAGMMDCDQQSIENMVNLLLAAKFFQVSDNETRQFMEYAQAAYVAN